MKHDAERDKIREKLKIENENGRYQIDRILIGVGIIFSFLGIMITVMASDLHDTLYVISGFFIMASGICFPLWGAYKANVRLNEAVEKEMQKVEKRQQQNQRGKDHSWRFPAEEFYTMCAQKKMTDLNNEYSFIKATNYAQQLITQENPLADMSSFNYYLERETLQNFLKIGQMKAQETAQAELARQKIVQSATPAPDEATFLKRVSEIKTLAGCQKRVKMLTDLLNDCSDKIDALEASEAAMKQLAMVYAGTQKKESDWAILGGVANGIAGPVASAAVVWDTMKKNNEIERYNANVRQASMDVLNGAFAIAGDRSVATDELESIELQLEEAEEKISFPKPDAKEIWENFLSYKKYRKVTRSKSGVLKCTLGIQLRKPFVLDVPEGLHLVIDGTINAKVMMEETYIGDVYFPLPIYGIPCDMTENIILDGMCDRSMEYKGKYTLELAEQQNLWIMEA